MTNILHLNTADLSGGAARAAYLIHREIQKTGYDSRMLVRDKTAFDDRTAEAKNKLWRIPDRIVREAIEVFGFQDIYYPSNYRLLRHPWMQNADVIHCHNLHGRYFAFPLIRKLNNMAPIVWTLHDMWSFTGHCSYSYDCEKWKSGCGHCPLLAEDYLPLRKDQTAALWLLKKKTYTHSLLNIVAPSQWLYRLVQQSPLLNRFPMAHIPYGIDLESFCPMSQRAAREALGIAHARKVLLFIADFPGKNPRKGLSELIASVKKMPGELKNELTILIAGHPVNFTDEFEDISYRHVGYAQNDIMLKLIYCASDLFVSPSLADNLPLCIMESMACGIPVVGFDAGGIGDLVRHLQTGYLAKCRDVEDLSQGITLLFGQKDFRLKLGLQARAMMEGEYAKEIQGKRYSELYNGLIQNQSR